MQEPKEETGEQGKRGSGWQQRRRKGRPGGGQGAKGDEEPSSCPLGSGGGGAQNEKFRGVCGHGFDPSSALEEAGTT